jgi:hypothetical protein
MGWNSYVLIWLAGSLADGFFGFRGYYADAVGAGWVHNGAKDDYRAKTKADSLRE